MNKYDKDMEDMDLKIQIKKNDYQNMLDKRIDLEQTVCYILTSIFPQLRPLEVAFSKIAR